ncbi:Putative sporulation-specific glycosylase ydhD [uncultured Bacteroides sp.]|uniref:PBP1 and LysM peptidoglycan-binding domain-containing protein n=1 Tax=Bacteroides TaxID=816 RepID=UPI00082355B7|nr:MULTISPECIES: LysM peptidoglycan-binding domain-containing protein [Bacteroides]MCR8893397.1 LysM peptidoglycan-binding domain-containing protein [Bacteroides sp. ET336]MCU6771834.1 LysM peptidoglycan-binding domain-containing protein [Bacteroides cellulolyticus]MDN0057894.1 LysM peptidoglycan-binding domain-containing protein [Bacteroides caecigallinarum]SCI05558.1 Putative sporulation-specific glycosylase ydhD [uncultured Bacteroides sp.]
MKFIQSVFLALAIIAGSSIKVMAQATAESGYFLHTVTKGQSLYSISSMYNVTIDDIVRLNPGSDKQIREGAALKIPQAATTNSDKPVFHTIQAGETLYRLSVKYNVTTQAICEANPGLSTENFRSGQVIIIPVQSDSKPQKETPKIEEQENTNVKMNDWKDMHKVERKETIFSISREYGITEEELIAANPELKTGKLKKGTFLFIPYGKNDKKQESESQPTTKELTNEEVFSQNEELKKDIKTIKAAVMLPFMAGTSTNMDEQVRMVEYYEGFLMAVDSLKKQGVSIDLYTYDTKGREATLNSILSKKEMKNMDIIFGPAKAQDIDVLATFADNNNIRLVVPFAPKVDEVFKNPHIYQINTPQSYLYSEVYEHFTRKFSDSNVIFLNASNGDREKDEFIKGMKTELRNNGISYRDFTVTDNFYEITTVMDTLRNNIFIPTSGKSTALVKILPQLTQIRREHPNYMMNLFGYPEWQTYTNDYLASFYEIDTYFYSSFYTNNLFPAAVHFTNSYRRWYSKDMANIYPKYGMLGYDTGYFFLKGLSKYGNKMEENLNSIQVTPIQTGFKFERVNNWGGFINRKVFFVHFSKDYELIKLDFE